MKKVITISVILLIALGAGIFESIYINGYFGDLAAKLEEVSALSSKTAEDEVNEEVLRRLDEITKEWQKNEKIFYAMNNNNVLNNLFERILQARSFALGGQNMDACASLDAAAFYAHSIAKDILPIPINFI